MRNCEEMTRLISESMERPLTVMEKMEMSFHTMMCDGCKHFKSNTIVLKEITKLHNTAEVNATDTIASDNTKKP